MDDRKEAVAVMSCVLVSRKEWELHKEVTEAARALLSGPNGEEPWVQDDDWRRLQAALEALEVERGAGKEDRRIEALPTQNHYLGMLEE